MPSLYPFDRTSSSDELLQFLTPISTDLRLTMGKGVDFPTSTRRAFLLPVRSRPSILEATLPHFPQDFEACWGLKAQFQFCCDLFQPERFSSPCTSSEISCNDRNTSTHSFSCARHTLVCCIFFFHSRLLRLIVYLVFLCDVLMTFGGVTFSPHKHPQYFYSVAILDPFALAIYLPSILAHSILLNPARIVCVLF